MPHQRPIPIVALTVLCLVASSLSAAPADQWNNWQGDAGHTGYLPDTLLMQQRRFAWSEHAVPGKITAMVASNNAVFTCNSVLTWHQPSSSSISILAAQDIGDGHLLWSTSFPKESMISAPAYDAGMLFVVENVFVDFQSADVRFLDAFDARSGAPLYRVPLRLPGTMFDSPTVAGGHVYIESQIITDFGSGTQANWFGSLAAADGHEEWQSNASDGSMPTLANGNVYGFTDRLNVLDAASGMPVASIANPDDTQETLARAPVVAGTQVYQTQDGRVVAFDVSAQHVAWTVDVNAYFQMATDGAKIVYLSAGAMTVRDAQSGSLAWGWEAPVGSFSQPISDNMIVTRTHVILTDGEKTFLVNRATHQLEGNYTVGGLIALAADKLLVADESGNVNAFALPSDELFANAFE